MVKKIYSLYDRVTQFYESPMVFVNDNHAKREFVRIVMKIKHPSGIHPGDYDVYSLGEFDDSLGIVRSLKSGKEVVCNLKDLFKEIEDNGGRNNQTETDSTVPPHRFESRKES